MLKIDHLCNQTKLYCIDDYFLAPRKVGKGLCAHFICRLSLYGLAQLFEDDELCCRALQAGEKEPILKAHVLVDEVEKLAESKKAPHLMDSGFARLLKVRPLQPDLHPQCCVKVLSSCPRRAACG